MVKEKEVKKNKINLEEIVNKAQSFYGPKEKALSLQISTGDSIAKLEKDSDYILWKDSPWEKLTGIRGIPFGRICQLNGLPDSGKSSTALKIMSVAQAQGVQVVYMETEGKTSMKRFDTAMGGSSKDLLVISSKMILEGGDLIEKSVAAIKEQDESVKILIVIDNIGSALASTEDEDSLLSSNQMLVSAKENGRLMRALVRIMEKNKNKETGEYNIAVLLINQTYSRISAFASGQKASGGQKVEYYSSIIVQLTRKADVTRVIKGVKMKSGILSKARITKNHLFDGIESVSEMDWMITAGEILLASDKKMLKSKEGDDVLEEESEE